ncbi:MAG: hypothetical protein H0T60_06125 [Acidobacteria bacterium]|nr:hypothetical protein [Acidobacteriota bacterium]
MQNRNEVHTHAAERAPAAQQERKAGENIGVRGCWELLIKLIILVVLILILFAWYFGRGESIVGRNPYAWLILLFLILLLLWLIWLQKHFVSLNCELTAPDGCVIGHKDILSGRALEPVVGTATGVGFVRYTLELIYMGPGGDVSVADGIVYADSGVPDTTPPFGNHQVSAGTLGYVDLEKAGQAAGVNLQDAEFRVRMVVFGLGGVTRTCEKTFKVVSVSAYIKTVGGAVAHHVSPPAEPLRIADSAGAPLATVGGSLTVRGAADVFGCDKRIDEYHVWVIPGFGFAQPSDGGPVAPGPDWVEVASVVYTDPNPSVYNSRVNWNRLIPPTSFLTNVAWSTREEIVWFDGVPITLVVPDLIETSWNSLPRNGKFTVLLQLIDEDSRTFYDIQQVWIDNKDFLGKITSLGYQGEPGEIPPCADIEIHDNSGNPRILEIRGYATDPLIIAGDESSSPAVPGDVSPRTSDNFEQYGVTFRKQGAAAENALLDSTTPMPSRATWRGAVGQPAVPPVGVLAALDLSALDLSTGPNPNVADDQRLAPGESCTYLILLRGSDSTIVSESSDHQIPGGFYPFPVKIINNIV